MMASILTTAIRLTMSSIGVAEERLCQVLEGRMLCYLLCKEYIHISMTTSCYRLHEVVIRTFHSMY